MRGPDLGKPVHVRTLTACIGLLLVLTACGSAEPEVAELPPVSEPAPAESELSEPEAGLDAEEGDYWSPKRVAALEAAKASFVPPEPDEATVSDGSSPVVAAPQPAPAPAPTTAPQPTQTAQPVEPVEPPRQAQPVRQPPAPAPVPVETDAPLLPLPGEDGPLFIVADRTAAVAITGCTVDEKGQRRIAYDVLLLSDDADLPVLAERVEAEHSATSRTVLITGTVASKPMSFELIEDDPERTEDFTVPTARELHLGTAEDGDTVVVPSAIVPVQACR